MKKEIMVDMRYLLRGYMPIDSVKISRLTGCDEVISCATEMFLRRMPQSDARLQIKNSFGHWQPLPDDYESILKSIEQFFKDEFKNATQQDASRWINGFEVTTYQSRPLAPARLMDFSVDQTVRLGDGMAIHSHGDGWQMSQRKGEYNSKSHLLIRQLPAHLRNPLWAGHF